LAPAAVQVPGIHLAVVRPEADRGAEREGRVLAEVVVRRRMAELYRARLHRVEHLQRRDDLAGGEGADLEIAVGDLAYALGHELGAAEKRLQALRPARREAPLDLGILLRDRRGGERRDGRAGGDFLQERAAPGAH